MREFEKPISEQIVEPSLLDLPEQRAGYSDRTAWLMAVMSQLAYFEFENRRTVADLAADLAKLGGDSGEIKRHLLSQIGSLFTGGPESRLAFLSHILGIARFDLIEVFDVGDTQAFLARRRKPDASGRGMLVLAFRGTEKSLGDWRTDLRAKLVPARDERKPGLIHQGFQESYYAVEAQVEKALGRFPGEPLYLTGHSLGGALAVVATRFLDAGSLAACYTFGSPRIGDLSLAAEFKTPIYRIVNAADTVPRLPFGEGYALLMRGLRRAFFFLPFIPVLGRLHGYLDRIAGYTHYGDERYLTAAAPGINDTYPGLALIPNPGFFLRLERFVKRAGSTGGSGLIRDHAIGVYRAKLRARAISRNYSGGRPATFPCFDTSPPKSSARFDIGT